jgi:uncharacterized membrane protein YcaP (DUF421 family)
MLRKYDWPEVQPRLPQYRTLFRVRAAMLPSPSLFLLKRAAPDTSKSRSILGGDVPNHDIWKDMFVLGLPLIEKILRPVFVYAFLVVSLRLSGKRELVQLNPFDLVVLLTLSNTVQNAIIGDDNSVSGGLIGATSLLAVNYLVVRFLYGHKKLEQIVEGQSDVLIENGKVKAERLRKELITTSQLEAAARKQGFDSLAEVETCILEPGGTLSFVARKPASEETRHQEVVSRLDKLMQDIAQLRVARPPAHS